MAKKNPIIAIIEAWGKLGLSSQLFFVLVILSVSAAIFFIGRLLGQILSIITAWSDLSGFEQIALLGLIICFMIIIIVSNFFATKKYKKSENDYSDEAKKEYNKHDFWKND